MTTIIYLLLCIIALGSCQTDKSKEENASIIANIDIRNNGDVRSTPVKYISLETTDNSLINSVSKVIFTNNKFYILDLTSKSVFVFSSEGKYLFKIHRVGEAPGEYIDITDADISNKGDIYIADVNTSKVLKYTDEGTKYKEIKTDITFLGVGVCSDSILCFANIMNEGKIDVALAKLNTISNHSSTILPHDYSVAVQAVPFTSSFFYRSNNTLLFYHRFTPFIYIIEEGKLRKYIQLVTDRIPGKEQLKKWEAKEITFQSPFDSEEYIYAINSCFETNDHLFLEIWGGKTLFQHIVIDKKANNKVYNTLSLGDNMINHNVIGIVDDSFVTYTIPTKENVSAMIRNDKNMNQETKNTLLSLKEDDNPVLILFQVETEK
ncbi:MAG: 6-bladed beta-propeller [Mediterranea sp.]|nr:6-bladed beta-propeller [Mediterranea sp.]